MHKFCGTRSMPYRKYFDLRCDPAADYRPFCFVDSAHADALITESAASGSRSSPRLDVSSYPQSERRVDETHGPRGDFAHINRAATDRNEDRDLEGKVAVDFGLRTW
jgi:hypothetical protein